MCLCVYLRVRSFYHFYFFLCISPRCSPPPLMMHCTASPTHTTHFGKRPLDINENVRPTPGLVSDLGLYKRRRINVVPPRNDRVGCERSFSNFGSTSMKRRATEHALPTTTTASPFVGASGKRIRNHCDEHFFGGHSHRAHLKRGRDDARSSPPTRTQSKKRCNRIPDSTSPSSLALGGSFIGNTTTTTMIPRVAEVTNHAALLPIMDGVAPSRVDEYLAHSHLSGLKERSLVPWNPARRSLVPVSSHVSTIAPPSNIHQSNFAIEEVFDDEMLEEEKSSPTPSIYTSLEDIDWGDAYPERIDSFANGNNVFI